VGCYAIGMKHVLTNYYRFAKLSISINCISFNLISYNFFVTCVLFVCSQLLVEKACK
jgi:hypothetical protein